MAGHRISGCGGCIGPRGSRHHVNPTRGSGKGIPTYLNSLAQLSDISPDLPGILRGGQPAAFHTWALILLLCLCQQDVLVNGPLGKSGFLAAFSLIFLSEIGDKTFFIAALLAMKLGKWISFAGSVSSLSLMTIVSVAIGAIFSRVSGWRSSTH